MVMFQVIGEIDPCRIARPVDERHGPQTKPAFASVEAHVVKSLL